MTVKFHLKDSLEAKVLPSCPRALHQAGAEARPSAASDTWAVSHGVSPACCKNDVSRSGAARERDSLFLDSWLTSVNRSPLRIQKDQLW